MHTPDRFTDNAAPTDFANPAVLASVNNANSYTTAPGNNIDKLQQFTLAFWVRINRAAPFPAVTLVSLNNGKAGFGYYDQGNLYFDINVNGLPRRLFKLDSNIADRAYHMDDSDPLVCQQHPLYLVRCAMQQRPRHCAQPAAESLVRSAARGLGQSA